MKPHVLFLTISCTFVLCAKAAIIEFEIGGKAGPGLISGNLNGPPNGSAASGGEISSGISYNDVTRELTLNFGWGSHQLVGGVDLTSDFLHAYLQGPASVNGNGGLLYTLDDLGGYNPANTGGRSGFINMPYAPGSVGPLTLSVSEGQDLVDGLIYINVASANLQGGEIRGQLTAVPEPAPYAVGFGLMLAGFAFYRRVAKSASH